MVRILAGALALGFFMLSAAQASVTVMFSYADWCAPCQVLRPNLEAALEQIQRDDVDVIYLDFTEITAENFDAQFDRAKPLSPGDFIVGRFVKTGFAYLIVSDSIVGELRANMSVAEIIAGLDGAE